MANPTGCNEAEPRGGVKRADGSTAEKRTLPRQQPPTRYPTPTNETNGHFFPICGPVRGRSAVQTSLCRAVERVGIEAITTSAQAMNTRATTIMAEPE